ncbi:hypothetical protein FOA52_015183 [Chlamydomonas sp. UWO 241]|nr:hypothetical protein FOA52_015183 [Chlamydomonas sp. UWO 241]
MGACIHMRVMQHHLLALQQGGGRGSGRGRGGGGDGGSSGSSSTHTHATPTSNRAFGAPDLTPDLLLQYERAGWLRTRGVLPADAAAGLATEIEAHVSRHRLKALQQRVRVLCPEVVDPSATITSEAAAMEALSHTELGFLQFFNTHRTAPQGGAIRGTVLGEHLGAMAAVLLGVDAVRVYQDCVFVKQPGFGETNWHSDLRMTPFDTNASVTCWLPMRAVESGERDSGLLFAEGSHRDFALPFWHDARTADLEARGYNVVSAGRLLPGDCTWHHGWTVHSAGPQLPGSLPRTALAVTFIADGARTLDTRTCSLRKGMRHDEDAESYSDWLSAVKPGAPARHPLLPLTYKRG